ncbi:TolC family protein [Empedobacter stercoris]|uniref:TolC family protein n=2 Tax=Empedobacter TaxID=59734 RepID=A0ABY8VDR7_9FLAO|nr:MULTISPECIES: TolC family protein [Empedobacter]MCA4782529.1 TolC family protein [Empedobacter stercoris]NOJ74748.1 TolC family protein [Empedobacter stercoris]UWX67476.1 TolC family protein [Empedobacter stercoris]WIH97660.1 TolC family protein [Empedobacter falsenii]HJD87535.1 TolC family protein [Empedobacter falsenii]
MKKYRILNITLIAAGLFAVQSCFVAKDYNRPEAVVNEANFRTDVIAKDSANVATVSWKQIFTDSQLQALINQGLQNNLDIRSALQNIAVAEAYAKQGKAGYLPTLSVGPKYSFTESSKNTPFGAMMTDRSQNQYELSGNLSWEADIWGKIRSNQRASAATYLQTIEAHKAVKTQIVASIANAYYNLLALDEQKRILDKTLINREQSLETTKALKEAGSVTEVAVNQTEAQLYSVKSMLVDVENGIKLNENVMSILLGTNPQSINRTNLASQQVNQTLSVGVPAQLLENRPDIKAAEFGLMNAFENVNIANASFYPSLTISATGGVQGIDIDKLFNAQSLFASVIGGLTQPLLQQRRLRTQKEVALANQENALINYKSKILNASKEVSDALYTYDAATKKVEYKQKEYQLYNQAITYSEELLNYGMANYLEVITARDNGLNAELNVVDAKLTSLSSMVELYRAVGGGWQ